MSTKLENPPHIPVLLQEVLAQFQPLLAENSTEPFHYLDGTLGRGGHLTAILESGPNVVALGLDRDPEALDFVSKSLSSYVEIGRLKLAHRNFMSDDIEAEFGQFDGILLDLGVSSPQLDLPQRGFSFYNDGPLDMRMDQTQGPTAAEYLKDLSEDELYEVFQKYGEVRNPRRVVRAIVNDRKTQPFETTKQLAGLIERVDGWTRKGFHPATTYFLALRLVVNREIIDLELGLQKMMKALKPKGRLAVITFHSIEDRIAKYTFRDSPLGQPLFKRVIIPSDSEQTANPRSRSAKLRVFEKASIV